MPDPRIVLVFGGPGAGKGTQASLLATALGVPHISSGDLLRQRERGAAQQVMNRGDLIPDDEVARVMYERLSEPDAGRGAILDGFPRTLQQASDLDQWLRQRADGIRAAVYLEVPGDVLVERMLARGRVSGRQDDNPTAAANRVSVFLDEMPPVLDHYADGGLLRRIDGTPSVEEIQRQIIKALTPTPSAQV